MKKCLNFLFFIIYCQANAYVPIQSAYYIDTAIKGFPTEQLLKTDKNTFQLITHGRSGELLINGEWKNAAQIADFLKYELEIKNYRKDDYSSFVTHLNIYGCEFAKGQNGLEAVAFLEKALNISVSASTNITGKDGDWKLEVGKQKNLLSLPDYKGNLQSCSAGNSPIPVAGALYDFGVNNGTNTCPTSTSSPVTIGSVISGAYSSYSSSLCSDIPQGAQNGKYRITDNFGVWGGGSNDHTPGDVKGRYFASSLGLNTGGDDNNIILGFPISNSVLPTNQTVFFCFWYITTTGSPPVLKFRLKSGSTILNTQTINTVTGSTGVWVQACVSYFVPSGTSNVNLELINTRGETTGNDIMIDDISLSLCSNCPTITNTASDNVNPSCGSSDGSIKICGLTANSTGNDITYTLSSVTTTLNNKTADANGCITITGLAAGVYSNIKVINASCNATNALSVTLTATPTPAAPSTASASSTTICSRSSTNLTGTCASGSTLTWYKTSVSATNLVGTGTNFTVSPTASTTYLATCVNGTCNSTSKSVAVTVNTTVAPTGTPAGTAVTCPGGTTSLTETGCASGTTVTWFSDAALTSQIGTGSPLSATANTSPTTTFYVACVNNTTTCKSTAKSVAVAVTAPPSAPSSVSASPTAVCSGSPTTLSGTCAAGTLTWYSNAGLTTLVGTGTGLSVTPPTSTTITTVTYYGACVNGTCKSTSTSVVVTVNPIPTAPTITPTATTICAGTPTTLEATGCTGTVTWFEDGSSTLLYTGTSYVVSPAVTKSYVTKCTTSGCTSAASAVSTITVVAPPSNPSISASASTICSGKSVTLTGLNCDAPNVLNWYVKGNATAFFTGTTTSVSPTATTIYTASCSGTGAVVCTNNSLYDLTITVNPIVAAPSINVTSSTICSGNSTTLTATCATGETYLWSNGATTNAITVQPTATTDYTVKCISSLNCESPATSTTITVTATPVAPTNGTASPITVCSNNNSVVLSATCATGTLKWYTTAGLTDASEVTSPVTVTATTTYYGSCVLSGCKSPSFDVVVNYEAAPNVPSSVSVNAPSICAGESTALLGGCTTGTLTWYSDAGLNTQIGTETGLSQTPSATTTYYAACITSNCRSGVSSATVTVKPLPTATASSTCVSSVITLATAEGGTGATYSWTGPDGFSSTEQNPAIFPYVSAAKNGTYNLSVTLDGCTANSSTVVDCGTQPFPVTILSFVGQKTAFGVEINWQVADEVNVREFKIERSNNAKSFEVIGSIEAKNITQNHAYAFIDKDPFIGTQYYRLQAVDFDASKAYSKIIAVNNEIEESIKIYPNPINEDGSFYLFLNTSENIQTANLVSLEGRSVGVKLEKTKGHFYKVQTGNVLQGMYLLLIQTEGAKYSIKVVR